MSATATRPGDRLEHMFAAAKVLREAQIPASTPGAVALFRELIELPDQPAMVRRVREAAGTPPRTYTKAARQALAEKGQAMPDKESGGRYPVRDSRDVEDAVNDWGRNGSSPDVKAHIIQAAQKVGATDALPADWAGSTKKLQESAAGLRQAGLREARSVADLAHAGIPTLDGPVRLREATSAAELGQAGIPLRSTSPLAGQRHSELPAGIPTLAPGTGALSRTRLTESVGGGVLRRVA
jgi:hypothetical protein